MRVCCLKTNSTFVSTYIKGHTWAYNWEFLTHIKNPIFILQHCITYDECCPSLELPYSEKTSKFDKWYRPPYKLFFTDRLILRSCMCWDVLHAMSCRLGMAIHTLVHMYIIYKLYMSPPGDSDGHYTVAIIAAVCSYVQKFCTSFNHTLCT